MENKVVNLEIKSNVDESIAGLKALKRQLKDTAAGSAEFKQLYNQIDDLEDKIKSSKNASSDWVDSLEQAGGPLGMVGASLNRAKVATQSFGGALKATGIGLFVSLIGGLVAAFSENEGAMKKIQPVIDGLKKAFQGVFRAVEPLFNTFVDLATEALPYVTKGIGMVYSAMMAYFTFIKESGGGVMKILKGIFTLDADAISEGIDKVGGSFKKTQESYGESMKRFSAGSKELTQTEKDEAEKREANRKEALEKKQANEEKAKEKAIQKAKEEKDELAKIAKEKLDKEMQSAKDAMAILDELKKSQETPAQKEIREYEEKKAILLANNLDTILLDQKHKENLALIAKTDAEKKAADDKIISDKIAADKKSADDKDLEFQRNKDSAIAASRQNLNNILSNLETSGLNKSKAGQAISKAIALTQIGIDSAVAISKASTLANAEGVAAQLAFPLVPGIGTIARVVSYASTAASVIGNISRAKQLLSSGGSGGGASTSGSAPSSIGGGGASAAPSFNVVGASSTNQLAQTIGSKEQQPIKTYVVAGDISTAQSLERNIISSASIG
jgi:hypothetical protein